MYKMIDFLREGNMVLKISSAILSNMCNNSGKISCIWSIGHIKQVFVYVVFKVNVELLNQSSTPFKLRKQHLFCNNFRLYVYYFCKLLRESI